jgi:hypothetical protein
MRFVLLLPVFLLAATQRLDAQLHYDSQEIDRRVRWLDAPGPDSLARLLVAPYRLEVEKARAIYSWIAQHIGYNTHVIRNGRRQGTYLPEPVDTSLRWPSAVEMTAIKAMRRRSAVCDGYTKLFKTLCDYAGLESVIITGYARGYVESVPRFYTNHSWNAVRIDSSWYLLDVTWGSGYVNAADQFVQQLDERYFMTPPEEFAKDHHPEDLKWALLEGEAGFREFSRMPFQYRSCLKYAIAGYFPSGGEATGAPGDTLDFEIRLPETAGRLPIAPDPFREDSLQAAGSTIYLEPSEVRGNRIRYQLPLRDPDLKWVVLLYNNDLMLRYRVRIQPSASPGPIPAGNSREGADTTRRQ